MQAILGQKVGMMPFLTEEGRFLPATALLAGPCVVTEIKTQDKHGYRAIKIGYGDDVKEKNMPKSLKADFAKRKMPLKRWLREVRLAPGEEYEVGQVIKADVFKPGDLVDVQGKSIGKGFAGGMKRWHWQGGPKSHGSMFHRHIGSAGASSFPSRTWPGQTMPGHLGAATCTVQNLEVLKVDAQKNLILVKGSVPGGDRQLLTIRRSLKQPGGLKPKVILKQKEKKDPLKASKQAAVGKKK